MKVLLTTNSEYGQANVFLAVGHALQALDPDVEIHFVSFDDIARDVTSASEYSVRCARGAQPWVFHRLDGPSFMAAVEDKDKDNGLGVSLGKRPTFLSTIELLTKFMRLLLPWDPAEFVRIYQSFAGVVDRVRPDMIVVDSLFAPVLTACRRLELRHMVLSPNTLKDFAAAHQPRAAVLWKFPMIGSGYAYPVPWTRIPANILFVLVMFWYVLTDGNLRAVRARIRRELGAELITFETLTSRPVPGQKVLVANRPEIEFPLAVIPGHVTPCGPVIRPVPPVCEVDPELEAWLGRGPTVFISLGTHRDMKEEEALEMARVVRQLLEAADGRAEGERAGVGGVSGPLQVLWKLKQDRHGGYETGSGSKLFDILGPALGSDRVRIVDWVKPQPSAVLQTGTVVCSVNHGGANSFHDALTAGVPQVVLPAWLDCYDFANRAEVLGIGRWGSRQSMPWSSARELGPILVDVVLGPSAESMRAKVRELAALCAKTPGASVAAAAILEEVEALEGKASE